MQETFISDVMRQALILISTDDLQHQQQSTLEPEEVVLVFHQFFVLDTLTFYSDIILALLQHKYFEEFKSVFVDDWILSDIFIGP